VGLIHSRASKQRNKAEAKVLKDEHKAKADARRESHQDAITEKWEPVVQAIEAGTASWDDLTRMQKATMPIKYILRCKAASRAASQGSDPEQGTADRLGKLVTLHDAGVITDEEFADKRGEILESL
jgi:hypothetical protein